MSKTIKILIGVVIFLGILSGVFLLTAKKKPQTAVATKVSQTTPANGEVVTPKTNTPASVPASNPQKRKTLIRSQWTGCKEETLSAETNLFWNVQITEGIPTGGTYAKGNLDNDSAYPVHVTIKSDTVNAEKIKSMLVVGKTAFLKGTCVDVATDGAIVLQAF